MSHFIIILGKYLRNVIACEIWTSALCWETALTDDQIRSYNATYSRSRAGFVITVTQHFALSAMIPLNPNIKKQFVYTRMSLKSSLWCLRPPLISSHHVSAASILIHAWNQARGKRIQNCCLNFLVLRHMNFGNNQKVVGNVENKSRGDPSREKLQIISRT